jgi:hypothetical protein
LSRRAAAWVAWSSVGAAVALAALGLLLEHANGRSWFLEHLSFMLPFVAFATVGALVASRRPENPIGWILCAVGLSNLLWAFASKYAIYALITREGSLPGAEVTAWLGMGWIATLGWGLMATFLPLLFPTGKLVSPRWRPVAWLTAIVLALAIVAQAIAPGPMTEEIPAITNPIGIESAAVIIPVVESVGMTLLMAAVLASVASLVVRFRRSSGDERQQLKWFAYSAALLAISILLGLMSDFMPVLEFGPYGSALQAFGVSSIPIAVAIAILRYRLYEIDLLINRTLVYGSLTATLALVYLGSVVGLQRVLSPVVGEGNQLAVVVSTLLIAALFQPLRRTVQGFIDRRFYRRKYDAVKTLAAFNARLRDETELNTLSGNLVGVVKETMQPAHVSLWLRPPEH